jgi:hypothetical protein
MLTHRPGRLCCVTYRKPPLTLMSRGIYVGGWTQYRGEVGRTFALGGWTQYRSRGDSRLSFSKCDVFALISASAWPNRVLFGKYSPGESVADIRRGSVVLGFSSIPERCRWPATGQLIPYRASRQPLCGFATCTGLGGTCGAVTMPLNHPQTV